jgi:outer membrane protein OmpA-like peptidoglycan-associated protein
MNNKKFRLAREVLLPLLFCSAAVLAGDGGVDAPYGNLPVASQDALTLEQEQPESTCDSGDPSRGDCPQAAVAETADSPDAPVPDTMQQAQQLGNEADGFVDDATATGAPSLNTGYVGGKTRVGIGIDSEFKGKADVSHVFTENEDSAMIGQGYVGVSPKKEAGQGHITGAGAKLNYHWVSKDEAGQVDHVNKVFGAYDQNGAADKDGKQGKKVTVGYGQERENIFYSGSVMKGLSGKSDTGVKDANGNTVFEKAYDWGVGGRVGTFISEQQMRVQGGLDYEWGSEHAANESKAKQLTLTGGVEKFFPDSPHSVNANVDVYKKSGGYIEGDQKTEVRGGVGYRYDIASEAGIWQADKQYRRVRTEIPGEEIKKPAKVERKLVKHTMELEADTFFKVDSSKLTPEAQKRMESVMAKLRECGHEGNIRITGNTCDIGSTAHNQALSERRAKSVREFMVKHGFNGDELLAQGLGETSPKYPNTKEERHKNRRVDIEYVCYQSEYKDQVVEEGGTSKTDPKVVWKQELIPTPPLWVRQALHNVADHKQRVDTYKTTAGGEPAPEVCTVPVAEDDTTPGFTIKMGDSQVLDVMENDTICDKENTKITDVVCGGVATAGVTISADGKSIVFGSPATDAEGEQNCTYTIDDGKGNTSEAEFTVTVKSCNSGCNGEDPIAQPDNYTTDNATSLTGNVLDGTGSTDGPDVDPNGDSSKLKVTTTGSFDSALGGSITINADGSFTFDSKGVVGTHTFDYTIEDEEGKTDSARITIEVTDAGGSCPAIVDKTGEATYTFRNGYQVSLDAPNAAGIDVTAFLPSGKTAADIDSTYFKGGVKKIDFKVSTGGLDAGDLVVSSDNSLITFKSSPSYWCDKGTFVFYIKLKGCSDPIAVTYTITKN